MTVLLLIILITSYIMGVIAYPNGGGAYAISKDNFQRSWVPLLAASALMVDYVLTVAVSVSSGIQNLASSYPALQGHETSLSLLCVLIILLVNLRGISESSKVFAYPTYVFMACMLLVIGTRVLERASAWVCAAPHAALWRRATGPDAHASPEGVQLSLLRAHGRRDHLERGADFPGGEERRHQGVRCTRPRHGRDTARLCLSPVRERHWSQPEQHNAVAVGGELFRPWLYVPVPHVEHARRADLGRKLYLYRVSAGRRASGNGRLPSAGAAAARGQARLLQRDDRACGVGVALD